MDSNIVLAPDKTKISNYFTAQDALAHSQARKHDSIATIHSNEVARNIKKVARQLDKVVDAFSNVQIKSWYRCSYLEKEASKLAFKRWCLRRNLEECRDSWEMYLMLSPFVVGQAVEFFVPTLFIDDLIGFIVKELEFDKVIHIEDSWNDMVRLVVNDQNRKIVSK